MLLISKMLPHFLNILLTYQMKPFSWSTKNIHTVTIIYTTKAKTQINGDECHHTTKMKWFMRCDSHHQRARWSAFSSSKIFIEILLRLRSNFMHSVSLCIIMIADVGQLREQGSPSVITPSVDPIFISQCIIVILSPIAAS